MLTPNSPQENVTKAISMLDAISTISQAFEASMTILKHPLSEEDFNKLEEFYEWLAVLDKHYMDTHLYNKNTGGENNGDN